MNEILIAYLGNQELSKKLINPNWAYTALAETEITLDQFSDYYFKRTGLRVHIDFIKGGSDGGGMETTTRTGRAKTS